MATLSEIQARWEARQVEHSRLGTLVPFAALCAEVLDDLRELSIDDTITLKEASLLGGYSVDHLQRLVRQGTITNVGRKHAPRIRRQDVPTKPGRSVAALPSTSPRDQLSARRRIVADAQTRKGA
jgi:hypothetical protein